MNKTFFLFSSLFLFGLAHSQTIDTASIETFGNGVTLITYQLEGPKQVFVVEADITDPSISVEVFQPKKLTRTSVQSKQNSSKDHEVAAAINADFFDFKTQQPVSNCVIQRQPIKGIETARRSQFAVTTDKKLFFNAFYFHGEIILDSNRILPIHNLNTSIAKNDAVLFTSYFGDREFKEKTIVFTLVPVEGKELLIDDTLRYVVSTISNQQKISFKENAVFIAVKGLDSAKYISQLTLHDTVALYTNYFSESQHEIHIDYLVSGWGRLLRDNRNLAAHADTNESLTGKFTAVLHPRTFLGINSDTTKLFLCVVDGRQSQSNGMTFSDMANFLQHIGVTDAMNFDGGGSSTLVVKNKIVNSPSDIAGERPVASTIQIIYRPKR